MIILSILVFTASLWLIARWMTQYLSADAICNLKIAISAATQDGKYTPLFILTVSTTVRALLSIRLYSYPRCRLILFSGTLLVLGLSISDFRAGTILGSSEYPWAALDRYVDNAVLSFDREKAPLQPRTSEDVVARKAWRQFLGEAKRPIWKVVYTGIFLSAVLLLNFLFFYLSLLLTDHSIDELNSAGSWTQRFGVHLMHLFGSFMLSLSVSLCIGVFCNPVLWLVLLLAKAGIASGFIVLGLIAAEVFEWYVADPWFKVLMAVALLPGLALVGASGLDLLRDGARRLVTHLSDRILMPLLEKHGRFVLPYAATFAIATILYLALLALS
jgi:hypothetical protein